MAFTLQQWTSEIDAGQRVADPYYPKWQVNLDYYAGTPNEAQQKQSDYVNVNVDVYQVEQKTPQLFFETPDLQLSPSSGFMELTQGILAHRAILNALMAPDKMDALTTVQKAIKDCTCTAGRGATVLGYQPTMSQVQPDFEQPGSILGLNQPTPVTIHEAWFWNRISSKKFLAPGNWTDTEFDKAPWLAYRFRIPLKAAQQVCTLPDDFTGTTTKDERVLESGGSKDAETTQAYVDGTLVWYKAYLFDDDVQHPELYRRHILIDGLDDFADKVGPDGPDPAWASPYQTLDVTGRLTPDSLIGNPIDVLALRDVPDSQFPPSDSQMTRPLVKELCLFRTQMVTERDINKPKFGYKASLPPEAVEKIASAMTGSMIPLPDELWQGNQIAGFALLAQGSSPRQTYEANDVMERDIQKTLGISANQAGVQDSSTRTATEVQNIQSATAVRLDADRKRVLRWYLRVVDKVSALALRFLTDPRRVSELVGPQQAEIWLKWREALLQSGDPRPMFTARPNSQIKLDAAAEMTKWVKMYEFMRKDPLVNANMLIGKLFEMAGEDPLPFIVQQQPEKKPEPSVGFSFKGDDLNPMMPQAAAVVEILAQLGLKLTQTALNEAQFAAHNQVLQGQIQAVQEKQAKVEGKPHGGPADKMAAITKQTANETGQRSGPSQSIQ